MNLLNISPIVQSPTPWAFEFVPFCSPDAKYWTENLNPMHAMRQVNDRYDYLFLSSPLFLYHKLIIFFYNFFFKKKTKLGMGFLFVELTRQVNVERLRDIFEKRRESITDLSPEDLSRLEEAGLLFDVEDNDRFVFVSAASIYAKLISCFCIALRAKCIKFILCFF
jgi:hypothetical protein